MVNVLRNCVYALLGISSCLASNNVVSKEVASVNKQITDTFQWSEHPKLTWDDFRGAVNAVYDESAAATYCSIGFKTVAPVASAQPEIVVYNIFYKTKSWVRDDAHIQSILEHEQGHFDLCEIYTRKLKQRLSHYDPTVSGIKAELMNVYSELSKEYEARQQAYEQETVHGTNFEAQKRWQAVIAGELDINGV